MKITCTQEEKDFLIDSYLNNRDCACQNKSYEDCYKCIEVSIEWQIEDGEHE